MAENLQTLQSGSTKDAIIDNMYKMPEMATFFQDDQDPFTRIDSCLGGLKAVVTTMKDIAKIIEPADVPLRPQIVRLNESRRRLAIWIYETGSDMSMLARAHSFRSSTLCEVVTDAGDRLHLNIDLILSALSRIAGCTVPEEGAIAHSSAKTCARESEAIDGAILTLADITQTLVDFQSAENHARFLPRPRQPDPMTQKSIKPTFRQKVQASLRANIVAKTDTQSLVGSLTTSVFSGKEDEARLIIGFDFGTTYSGIAYALSTKPEEIHTITQWPGMEPREAPKVPTLIKYETDGTIRWGYNVERGTSGCLEGITYLLDPEQPESRRVPLLSTEHELKRLGRGALEVATDYLRLLLTHAMTLLEKNYSKSLREMMDRRRYVLTVPAIWSDKAKDAIISAADEAGIFPVTLINGPEAAGFSALNQMRERGLEVGDAFVVCDAGGGTVDLSSYEVTALRPLPLKELVASSGDFVGSLMLNVRFDQWMKEVLGEQLHANVAGKAAYRRAIIEFDEVIKVGFTSRDEKTRYIELPGDKVTGKGDHRIALTGEALYSIFQPVCRDVERLVDEQVKNVNLKRINQQHPKATEIKALLLVGGFGSNEYLFKMIADNHKEIEVIQPYDAWSATVRGAVMSQLPLRWGMISRPITKHYGTARHALYDPSLHPPERRYFDTIAQVYKVSTMVWFVAKGDDPLDSRTIEFPFYKLFTPNPPPEDLPVRVHLLQCSVDEAPENPYDNTVSQNCTLETDLSLVPRELFRKQQGTKADGAIIEWLELHYQLRVTFTSGRMTFSLVVGGKEYGSVDVIY